MFVLAEIIAIACFISALVDMGMNGGRNAGWAPWGIGITIICAGVMWVT
jgi:hypothetical protein